jgi:hypothetical protein
MQQKRRAILRLLARKGGRSSPDEIHTELVLAGVGHLTAARIAELERRNATLQLSVTRTAPHLRFPTQPFLEDNREVRKE